MKIKLWISLFLFSSVVQAQKKYDLFYLSIGSVHYWQDGRQLGFEETFDNLDAAETSANKMAELFDHMGAWQGKRSISTSSQYITQVSIIEEVEALISSAKKSKARHPLLIVYYAGHGYSSGQYKAHFIPPGNFKPNPALLDTEDWLKHGIDPLKIRTLLDQSKMDYMLILDCCYSGEQKETMMDISEEEQDLTGTTEIFDLFGQLTEVFEHQSTMTGPDPVVFSCEPGEAVPVTLYDFGDGKEEVAPLCRRSYIIFEEKLTDIDISLSDYLVMIMSDELDHRTDAAFSTWSFDSKNLKLVYRNE